MSASDLITGNIINSSDPGVVRLEAVCRVDVDHEKKEAYKVSGAGNYGYTLQTNLDNIVEVTEKRKEYTWPNHKSIYDTWFAVRFTLETTELSVVLNTANKLYASVIELKPSRAILFSSKHKAKNSLGIVLRNLEKAGLKLSDIELYIYGSDLALQKSVHIESDSVEDLLEMIDICRREKDTSGLNSKKKNSTVKDVDNNTELARDKTKTDSYRHENDYTKLKEISKQCTVVQHGILPVHLHDEDTVAHIEDKLKKAVIHSDIAFWGDLDFSRDDLEILKERLVELIKTGMTLVQLFRHYSYSLVNYAVFTSKYYYNGDFWGMISDGIGAKKPNPQEQTHIRNIILTTFDKCHLDYSVAFDSSRKYVDSVLYQVGTPPISNFGDLFYLFKYGMMANAEPQILVDEITSSAFNVHKPLLHFLEKTPEERTINFILDVQDTYLSATQADDLSGKYSEAYSDWYELDKEKASYRNKKDEERVEVRPYFTFDSGKMGLCIVLPRQNMVEEWVEGAKWDVLGTDGFHVTKECYVQGVEAKRFTEQIIVPVRPCESYTLIFEYDDGFEQHPTKYELKGIGRNEYLYFGPNGRRIIQNHLRVPYGIMVCPADTVIEANNIERDLLFYPTITSDYRVEQIIPTDIDAEYVLRVENDEVVFQMKPQIDVKLDGKKLFSCENIDSEIPIFVEIPKLEIGFQGFTTADGIELRTGRISLVVDDLSVEESTSIDISGGFEDEDYGIKTVRIYQFNRFLKQVRFCILPEFETNYDSELRWPEGNLKTGIAKMTINKIAGWEMIFTNASTQDLVDKYVVSVPYSEGVLNGSIVSKLESLHVNVDFKLPICAYKAELVSEKTISERCDLEDFLEGKVWASVSFYGEYRDYEYTAELVSINGIRQKKQLRLSNNGTINFDLTVFRDTIQAEPLPVKIRVSNNETEEKLDIILIEEVSKFSRRPGYKIKSKVLGIWDEDIAGDVIIERYGSNNYSQKLYYEDSNIDEKGWRVFELNENQALTTGYYRVVRESSLDNLFLFDDEFAITLDKDQFFVSSKTRKEPVSSFKIWLEQIICEILKNKSISKIDALKQSESYMCSSSLHSLADLEVDGESILNLVILGQMLEAKISNKHKNIICELMSVISRDVLSNQDRYRIIAELVNLKASDNVFRLCLENYALMLFEYPYDEKKMDIREIISGVKVASSRLALLMLMRLDSTIRDTLGNATFRDIIGQETIMEMLQSSGSEERRIEDKKHFLKEDGWSKVHIRITKEISGENRFYEMIDKERSRNDRIFLDKSKIPEDGIYLNGTRYTDLFVNWYIRNHPGGGSLNPYLDQGMRNSYERFKNNVFTKLQSLKYIAGFGKYLVEYDAVLKSRASGESVQFSLPNYFYFVALAAFITRIDAPGECRAIKDEANKYMIDSFRFAPLIAERDIIMASLFLFLRKKEG